MDKQMKKIKEMFKENDKALSRVEVISRVVLAILIMGVLSAGIIGISMIFSDGRSVSTGLLVLGITAATGLLLWVIWAFIALRLSYYVDIKLIRNKLYGVDNNGLAEFLGCKEEEKKRKKAEEGGEGKNESVEDEKAEGKEN